MTETQKQTRLEAFLKSRCQLNGQHVYRAFLPLLYLTLEGDWTEITPNRVTLEEGRRFFEKLRFIQTLVRETPRPQEFRSTNKFLRAIGSCRYFIYQVRNNIFHGSKPYASMHHDLGQMQRILVYDLFLKCLNSLFFLLVKPNAKEVGSDVVQIPIPGYVLPPRRAFGSVMKQDDVLKAVICGIMKDGDARLIAHFAREISPIESQPDVNATLFYPSAGKDLLTPIILGLPYCRSFFFCEMNLKRPPACMVSSLRAIDGVRDVGQWERNDNVYLLNFEFHGTQRTVHYVKQDNQRFLEHGKHLAFYFHRGDSWGEGGSGQQWDSELLPHLISLIPEGKDCVFLTDGEPGGLHLNHKRKAKELILLKLQRKNYFIGRL